MCNINMKGGNSSGAGSGSSSSNCRRGRTRNGNSNNNNNQGSNSSNRLQRRPVNEQQLLPSCASSAASTFVATRGGEGAGDGGGFTEEQNEGSSTMYEINTCSGAAAGINYNPGRKSKSSSSSDAGSDDDVAGERLKGGGSEEEEKQDPVKLDKKEAVGDGEEAEIIFLDVSILKRLWHQLSSSASKSLIPSSSSPSRGHRKSSLASASAASAVVDQGGAKTKLKKMRCDENLNEFYVVLVIVTIVCYWNGLSGDFVHDDIPAIKMNKDVLALNPLTALFKNDFWGTAMSDAGSHKSYRPLTTVSFRLNYLLFGLRPQLFHLTNILLHAAVCILFTRLCFSVAGLQRQFAFIAGVIFATHPIHSEAVTGIVGRADVLACLFFLLSLLLYHDDDGHPVATSSSATSRKFWLSIACGGLSMLAKETGITVLLVNVAYDGYKTLPHHLHLRQLFTDVRWTSELRQFLARTSLSLLFIVIFCTARMAIGGSLPKFSQQDNPAAYHPCVVTRFLTFSYLAAFNWWLMICPTTLSHDWQMSSIPLVTAWSDPRNLLTVLIVVLLIGLVCRSVGDFKTRQGHSSLLLGLLMLTVPFLPASNIIVTVGFVVAERVLYIPSLGSILLTVYGMQLTCRTRSPLLVPLKDSGTIQAPPPTISCLSMTTNNIGSCISSSRSYSKSICLLRSTLRALVLLLCVFNGLKTIHRNEDWMSRESLLSAGLKVLPHNAKMHYNFGNFLRDTSQIPLAMHHYHVALELWPTYSSAHNNLGTLVRDVRQAEFHFLEAIRYSEGHLNAHFNLGQLYKRTNRTDQASRMLEKCIQMDPKFIPGYIELFKLKRGKPAEMLLREMAAIATKDQSILFMFGKWLMMHDYHVKAFNVFVRAFQVNTYERVGFLSYLNACQMLRHLGKARVLQFIIRFHWLQQEKYRKKGYQPNIYLREWAIKTELKYRARIYDPLELVEHKSIERDEPPQQQQPTSGWEGISRPSEYPVNQDQREEREAKEEENEEMDGEDENKSSPAYFSNQMDQAMFRLKFHANQRTCNITKWLYPIVKEKRRLLGPIQSPYMLEQILQNTQIHEKSAKNQRCIGSILRHLRMTRKWHHNNVVPYLMANLWDNL